MSKKLNLTLETISKTRLEALSDGIFAIVVTLLVLELKIPETSKDATNLEIWNELFHLFPKLLSWIVSFGIVIVIYLNHHRLFNQIRHISKTLFWINSYLLLCVSLIPFPTALMGENPLNKLAVSFYGLVMTLMSFGFVFIRLYLIKNKNLLLKNINQNKFRKSIWQSFLLGPLIYLLAIILAWVNIYFAFICFLFVPIYFMITGLNSKLKL